MTDRNDASEEDAENSRQLAAAVHQLVEATEREHEIKRAQIEVQSQDIKSNERIALASIEAQRDFHSQRFTRYNSHLIHRYCFISGMTFVVLLFCFGAIWLDAKDLVIDLFRLTVPLAVGLFGGYHWGAKNTLKHARDEVSDEG